MRETDYESFCKRYVEEKGGFYIKLPAMYHLGIPDRIALLPWSCVFLVETKTPVGKVSKIQDYMHVKIRKMGFKVYIVDDKKMFMGLVDKELSIAERKWKRSRR